MVFVKHKTKLKKLGIPSQSQTVKQKTKNGSRWFARINSVIFNPMVTSGFLVKTLQHDQNYVKEFVLLNGVLKLLFNYLFNFVIIILNLKNPRFILRAQLLYSL